MYLVKKLLGLNMSNDAIDSSVDECDLRFGRGCFRAGGEEGVVKIDRNDWYKMDNPKRGLCVIINNKEFDPNTRMSERRGTDEDASSLKGIFTDYGFKVVLEHNCTVNKMVDLVLEVANTDHKENDCFVLIVLSHGENNILYGCDKTIEVDELLAPLKKTKSLVGKPKLILIQACRGTGLDSGHDVEFDGEDEVASKIPVEADYLYAYSTVPGYFSWRNSTRGSWFVQAFVKNMEENKRQRHDMLKLFTNVNRQVACDFESNASSLEMHRKKQVPYIASTLTKDFYLTPK